jgi:hypothetical protein
MCYICLIYAPKLTKQTIDQLSKQPSSASSELMKRILYFIPIVFSVAIFLSTATHDNVRPYYTADIAITEQGNILLANKGTSELRMIDPQGKTLKSWPLAEPATGITTIHDRAYVTSSYSQGSLSCFEIGGEQNKAKFAEILEEARTAQDSVGGIVECRAKGITAGLGEPFFDSAESLIAHLLFSIPAVKGVEFGKGFEAARMKGSEHNDAIIDKQGMTATNNAGGIVGGITNGNELVVRAAIKPTASIAQEQATYNFESNKVEPLVIKGRHDVCIALRAAVVVESAIAIALADLKLRA